MPEKRRIQLRNVQNVALGKTALIDCPVGPRYHHVQLNYGYTGGTNTIGAATGAIAGINEIRVKVNGRVQRIFSGAQLRDLNILNGSMSLISGLTTPSCYDCTGVPNTAPGVTVPIFFAEPWLTDEASQDALAWKTNLWNSMQIEVDLVTQNANSAPTLSAFAVVDDVKATGVEGINKILRLQAPAGGLSFDITTMDKRDWLRSLHIYPDSGGSNTPSEVDLRLDGGAVFHELLYQSNVGLITNFGMAPAATGRTSGIYDAVFDHDGLLSSAVNMQGRESVLTIKSASAMSGTTTVMIQRLGPPE